MYNDDLPFLGRDNNMQPEPSRQPAPAPVEDTVMTGRARIKVIGVGGAGNNAVNRMIEGGITSAKYVAVNTDAQILACSKAETRIQIGGHLTKGLGAGADPEIGRNAAEESKDELVKAVENTDLLFITAGMGGGTGTGAAPVIAKIARDKKILTVAVVTEPFSFEGRHRRENSMIGIENLKKNVDTIIIIPNEKISDVAPKNATMEEALRVADDVLKQGIRGIADLIVTPALINLDFADVRTILKDKGLAHMGVGVAKGENRIVEAVRLAVNCPLLETTIEGATGVILNVVGGPDLTFEEVRLAASLIHSVVDYSANIIFGACIDENISDEVEVTVIATGFPSADKAAQEANAANARPATAAARPMSAPQYPANHAANAPQRPQYAAPVRQPSNAPAVGAPQTAYGVPVQPAQPPVAPTQRGYDVYAPSAAQQPVQQPHAPQTPPQYYQQPVQQQGMQFTQPVQQPVPPVPPVQQPVQQQNYESVAQNYHAPAQQPVQQPVQQQPQGYYENAPQQNGYAPVPPQQQERAPYAAQPRQTENEEEDDYAANPHDQKLPPFVQRLIGKKKK